ncbi:MAG: hypothetical protein WBG50_00200 [Desulfomonilaceae bacterium]
MRTTLSIVLLCLVLIAPVSLAQAEETHKNLITVKPSYHEATYVPQQDQSVVDPTMPPPPTPREQMYVFWILGKMLSYPIDKAESYIYSFVNRPKAKAQAPATTSTTPNPFASVSWSEIPPAPPVSGHAARAR